MLATLQLLPLADAPNAEWRSLKLGWTPGGYPRSAVVKGRLQVVMYATKKAGSDADVDADP